MPDVPTPSERPRVAPKGIDPRGPRFSAGITSVLLIVVLLLGLGTAATPPPSLAQRAGEPAFVLAAIITALFAWGAIFGSRTHPYGVLFRRIVAPLLPPPTELEDPRPPQFAQAVGLFVMVIALVLALAGVPYGLVAASAAAFIAAFLNSVFGYCLGCQIYLLLARLRGAVLPA